MVLHRPRSQRGQPVFQVLEAPDEVLDALRVQVVEEGLSKSEDDAHLLANDSIDLSLRTAWNTVIRRNIKNTAVICMKFNYEPDRAPKYSLRD